MIRRAAGGVVAVVVAACGGGGGGPDAPMFDATIGPVMVTGSVSYEDRVPRANGTLAAPVPVPARHVAVALVTLGGQTIGESVTADDGTFTINSTVDLTYGDSIHILAATTSADAVRPVEVRRPDDNVHGFGGAGFEAADYTNVDLLVSETSGEAGAFNVFDQLIDVVDRVRALGFTPQSLNAVWSRGNNDGTYYDGGSKTMFLLGASDDDDGYDDAVILHEAGHWIEDTLGRSDSPGGFHGGEPTDPNLAWSEGFATYFGMAVLGVPVYIDTNASGGWSYNGDSTTTVAPGGTIGQDVSEDMVTEILWDLGDTSGGDDDTFVGAHDAVLMVQPDYLRTASLRAVGEPGVDVVDFLDGFFLADGLTHCTSVTAIVTTLRMFPYDYNGPAGACL